MRTNWAAAGYGVLLASTLAVVLPGVVGLGTVNPYASHDDDYDIIRGANGEELVRQSFWSGPPGPRPDRRPGWQRGWERVFGPAFPLPNPDSPERLRGGIM